MNEHEKNGLFERLKSVEKNGLTWRMSGHTLDRLSEKNIKATYQDLTSMIHNAKVIEYKIDYNEFLRAPEERVVLRANAIVNQRYNLNVVYSLTNRKIITVWVNHIRDLHTTLDWSIYDKDLKVFGI